MTRGSKIERVEIEIKFTFSLSPLNIGTLTFQKSCLRMNIYNHTVDINFLKIIHNDIFQLYDLIFQVQRLKLFGKYLANIYLKQKGRFHRTLCKMNKS